MTGNSNDARNIKAWDNLYTRTCDCVWGQSPAPVLERFIKPVSATLNGKSNILDAATGEGRNLSLLLDLPGISHACDASETALNKIAKAHRSAVKTTSCNLASMPYPGGHFSFVLLWDTIETLPDIQKAMKEIARVTASGGFLLCNIPDEQDGIATIDMTRLGEGEYLYQDEYFYRFMSEDKARNMLNDHGFQIELAERHRWQEAPHPEFRNCEHWHESMVYLAKKV